MSSKCDGVTRLLCRSCNCDEKVLVGNYIGHMSNYDETVPLGHYATM